MSNSPRRSGAACTLLAALASLAGSACLYDAGQRCGPAMMFNEATTACVCVTGAIAVDGGCKPCADDEVVADNKCACAAGQTKSAANLCVTIAGLGDPCDTGNAPCTDPTYSFCATKSGSTTGTCTSSCASDADCGAAYTCATWAAQPHCRTFEGVGESCDSAADCTGDANFCDTFQTHTCGISGCSLTASECPRDTMCCDFSSYGLGTLCAGACQ
jgi:hypothetical protein